MLLLCVYMGLCIQWPLTIVSKSEQSPFLLAADWWCVSRLDRFFVFVRVWYSCPEVFLPEVALVVTVVCVCDGDSSDGAVFLSSL